MPTTVTINPDAQGFYNNWTAGSTTYTKTTAVSDASDATVIVPNSGVYVDTSFDSYTLSAMGVSAQSVVSSIIVTVRYSAQPFCTARIFGRLNSINQISDLFGFTLGSSGTLVTQEKTYDCPRPGGGAWSVADVDALEVGVYMNWSGTQPQVQKISVAVTYLPAGVQLEPTRFSGARHVLRYGSQPDTIELPLAPEFLRMSLTDDLPVWHALMPTPSGTGSGTLTWARTLVRVTEKTIDPNSPAKIITLKGEDLREFLHSYRDGGITPLEPGGLQDGNLMLDNGATRTYDGPPMTLLSPLSDLIVQVPEDVEAVNHQGRWHQGQATNLIHDSAFLNATTSGSPFGDWVGSAGIGTAGALNTSETIFASTASKHILVTGSSVGTAMLRQSGIPAAAAYHWLSFDHRETTAGGVLQVRVRNIGSTSYWNAGTNAWTTIATANDITNSTSAIRSLMYINFTTAATTSLQLEFQCKTSDTSFHIYYAQLEASQNGRGWPSSRIISGSTAVTRAATDLTVTNHSTARVLPATRGTYMCRYLTQWASSDVSTGSNDHYIWRNAHDANNIRSLRYAPASSGIVFAVTAGGVAYTVVSTNSSAFAQGTTGCVAITWQSTDGENGNANYTISITRDGLTQVTSTAGAFTEASTSLWYRGLQIDTVGAVGHWNGTIWDERVSPFVLTLAEIRRWMQRG